jgi:rfaE bifunctional protein kinase chain/domain
MSGGLAGYLGRFASLRVAVVGDYIADEFIYGNTSRISREAPVLVLDFQRREVIPGGGGNAAMNAAALGGKVAAIGAIGDGGVGKGLCEALRRRRIDTELLLCDPQRVTPTKMRILAGGRNTARQQVIRVDHEKRIPLDDEMEAKVIAAVGRLADGGADAIIVSDYGLGVVTLAVREAIQAAARRIVVTVDSRYAGDRFHEVTAITPNEEEVQTLLGYWPEGDKLDAAGAALLERTRARGVLITRGSQGMSLFEREAPRRDIPIFGTDEVADVTGAGDTVIAAFTLSLAAGASMAEAAEIANRAAGLVVMKMGTAVVEAEELARALEEGA